MKKSMTRRGVPLAETSLVRNGFGPHQGTAQRPFPAQPEFSFDFSQLRGTTAQPFSSCLADRENRTSAHRRKREFSRVLRGYRRPGLKTTETVPFPATGLPLIEAGLNRHCFTANSAEPRSNGGPLKAFAEVTLPAVSTTIATWTVPSTFIFLAISG